MDKRCARGDWVEVHQIILKSSERSKDVLPEDTLKVPLEAWIRGWALSEGTLGEEVEIQTPSGRIVRGTLIEINPGYHHTYGPSVPELNAIGKKLRRQLKEGDRRG